MIDGQKMWTSAAAPRQLDLRAGPHRPDGPATAASPSCSARSTSPESRSGRSRISDRGSEFSEVFFTGAGPPPTGGRWAPARAGGCARRLLGHERGEEAATNPILFRRRARPAVALARNAAASRTPDPAAAGLVLRPGRDHAVPRRRNPRHPPAAPTSGAAASVAKLYWSEYHVAATELALDMLGPGALALEGGPPCARSAPTIPARPTPPAPGRPFLTTPGPGRSTPAPPSAAQHPRRDGARPAARTAPPSRGDDG